MRQSVYSISVDNVSDHQEHNSFQTLFILVHTHTHTLSREQVIALYKMQLKMFCFYLMHLHAITGTNR